MSVEARTLWQLVLAIGLAVGCGNTPELRVEEAGPAPVSGGAPRVVGVDPPNGATDVDPRRTTLSVTFDRPMDRQGWSWVQESAETLPEMTDDAYFDPAGRTHTVGVRLEPEKSYVVWINSERFDYFRDLDGRPAVPFRWTFTTASEGTGPSLVASHGRAGEAVSGPRIEALDPPNGATEVEPGVRVLRVTFDREMENGWSWVRVSGGTFPEVVEEARFEQDRRTNLLTVRLEPATSYEIWLNSGGYQHFRSAEGVPLEPLRWTFTTAPGS